LLRFVGVRVIRPVSMWGPNAQGVRSRPDRSVVLNPGDVERMGFDFDEFDRLISEGTSEAERNPWDLVVDPETGELVERGERDRVRAVGLPVGAVEDALAADQSAVLPMYWAVELGSEDGVEEIYARVMGELVAEHGAPLEESDYGDLVWGAIHDYAERLGLVYERSDRSGGRLFLQGRFVPESYEGATEPSALPANPVPWEAMHENQRWEALGRTQEAQDLFDEGMISAEELERRRELSAEEMDRMYDEWRREDRQEREAQWEDPRPHSGDEFFHEFQATPALTGLGGFQSPRIPSGLPGFQSPGSMPSGLPGFQSPGMLSGPPGFQSPGVPSGPPGFGVPSDGLLRDLVSRMGDMPLEHKLALAAALAGAGLLTVGTGGLAGPALMAGGGLSLLGNQ